MNKLRHSFLGIGCAFLVAACGSESNPDSSSGGSPGVAGNSAAGQNGSGSAGKASAGGPGTAMGGSSSGSGGSPGAAGTTSGGAATTSGGSTSPSASGGSTSPATGGAPAAGSAGTPAGGSTGTGGAGPSGGTAGAPSSGAGAGPVIEELKVVTSAANAFWKAGTLTEAASGNADVTVNADSAQQTFTGFGGTFNERGWEALSWLSETDRAGAMKLLFDAADGAKFTYGRIPIGASDYAVGGKLYTLDDADAADPQMEKFSLERDKQYLIPFIKAAIAVNPDIRFWGSPWTPPPWMKSNNDYKGGNMKDDATVLDAFALYLAKFVEEYGKEGIKIMAIHPQNEPGFVQDYPSCSWTGALMAKFIGSHLGPTFQERNVAAEIFVGTMSNSAPDTAVLNAVAGDATAKPFVKGYGLQWGMIDVWGNLNMDKSLAIWQTEHKCGNYPWLSGYKSDRAPNDHAYGVESWGLIRDWIKKGVTSYSAWNMVLDPGGKNSEAERDWKQNALMTVDQSSKKLTITPTYYVFRHVSQYVDPGAKVVGTTGGDALAFKNPDGSVVAVLYNSGAAKMVTVAIGAKKYQFDMPGNGWATVNPQL
jgi:glucosylceramidase